MQPDVFKWLEVPLLNLRRLLTPLLFSDRLHGTHCVCGYGVRCSTIKSQRLGDFVGYSTFITWNEYPYGASMLQTEGRIHQLTLACHIDVKPLAL